MTSLLMNGHWCHHRQSREVAVGIDDKIIGIDPALLMEIRIDDDIPAIDTANTDNIHAPAFRDIAIQSVLSTWTVITARKDADGRALERLLFGRFWRQGF